MPLFTVSQTTLQPVAQSKFTSEKLLQQLVEKNLDTVFKSPNYRKYNLHAVRMNGSEHRAVRASVRPQSQFREDPLLEYESPTSAGRRSSDGAVVAGP